MQKSRILWVDCLGGLVVGVVVMVICQPLSNWENLPLSIVRSMGVANLLYGSYSLFVTTRNPRPMSLVKMLAVANMFWGVVCCAIVIVWWQEIHALGFTHLIAEGIYVAALGFGEWTWRSQLASNRES